MVLNIYNFLLPLLLWLAKFAGGFSPKLAATLEEREGLLLRWKNGVGSKGRQRILFHVASVGELEQLRPVIEELRKRETAVFLLSFFSPSVKRTCQDFSFVDFADYLPLDRREDMQAFFHSVEPSFIVLNRYDIWPNLMQEARWRNIPVALVNASTPPLGWLGWWSLALRSFLFQGVSAWSYVDARAAGAWEPYLGRDARALVTGDPRVDRAVSRVRVSERGQKTIARIREAWEFDSERTIVAGSTWAPDEELLIDTLVEMRKDPAYATTRMLLVPHEPAEESLQRIFARAKARGLGCMRFSSLPLEAKPSPGKEILVVDIMGVLAELYSLGNTAYVGGGFGRSVHSVIEPAAHHLPVAFGPKHQRMPEARTLVLMGGAASFLHTGDSLELAKWFRDTLRGGKSYQKARDAVDLFLKMHAGAGERVAQFLEEQLRS